MTPRTHEPAPPVRRELAHLARRGIDPAYLLDLAEWSERKGWGETARVFKHLLAVALSPAANDDDELTIPEIGA